MERGQKKAAVVPHENSQHHLERPQHSRPVLADATTEPDPEAPDKLPTSDSDREAPDKPTLDPYRLFFFDDATEVLSAELQSKPRRSGKAARLAATLVTFAEQQDSWDCDKAERPCYVAFHKFLSRARLRTNHGLHSWRYDPFKTSDYDEVVVSVFDDLFKGEQDILRSLVTHILLGSSRRQLLPIHVEVVMLLARMTMCAAPMPTKLIWKYRNVLARAIGGSVHSVEVFIRCYDSWLHGTIKDFLSELARRFSEKVRVTDADTKRQFLPVARRGNTFAGNPDDVRERVRLPGDLGGTDSLKWRWEDFRSVRQNGEAENGTDGIPERAPENRDAEVDPDVIQTGEFKGLKFNTGMTTKGKSSRSSSVPIGDDPVVKLRRKARGLEYAFHRDGKSTWSKRTRQLAEEIAPSYASQLAGVTAFLTELVAQFWDNIASMTFPIRKFEHGKNRYIFRMSTGELCTGMKVSPKLGLEEVTFGADAGTTGGKVSSNVIFRKSKPDLQVVTTDYAIDCSINVPLGRTRVLGMRERRALRAAMMLANYRRYNFDIAWDTDGMFRGTGQAAGYGPSAPRNLVQFTCNSPPDLISMLFSNQTVSTVSRDDITVITGFVLRGQHTEIVRDNTSLYARASQMREVSYSELVGRLLDNEWKKKGKNGHEPNTEEIERDQDDETKDEINTEELDRNDRMQIRTPPVQTSPSDASVETSSQENGWKPAVSGSARVLGYSKSAYLLTRNEGDPVRYQFHELTDAMMYDIHHEIYIL